jgi:hypothetical protein
LAVRASPSICRRANAVQHRADDNAGSMLVSGYPAYLAMSLRGLDLERQGVIQRS